MASPPVLSQPTKLRDSWKCCLVFCNSDVLLAAPGSISQAEISHLGHHIGLLSDHFCSSCHFCFFRDCNILWISSDYPGELLRLLGSGQYPRPRLLREETLERQLHCFELCEGIFQRLSKHNQLWDIPRPKDRLGV